ncbi:MAG: hypothetical protein NXY57DRAFT_1032771 [Lentinula lateritia]|nr:MAG: hypothetical protein NXY57DRAFT_1032771 [Lentinula lateritia]
MTDSESEIASQLLGGHQDDSDPGLESDTGPVASGSHHVSSSNNWAGKNQYENSPRIGDTRVHAALLEYHRRNITNKDTISQLLKADHNISLMVHVT